MQIVFIGPPGAGKGTQCKRLAETLGVRHLSTGELLREVRGQDSALARWVTQNLDHGQLAPDHLVMRIVGQRLKRDDCARGCLLDGVPRTMVQAQLLENCLHRFGRSLDLVIELRAEAQQLTERLLRRSKIEGRADDDLRTIRTRLRIYETQTRPLLEYYRQRRLLESVDGMQRPETVFEHIRAALGHQLDVLPERPTNWEFS